MRFSVQIRRCPETGPKADSHSRSGDPGEHAFLRAVEVGVEHLVCLLELLHLTPVRPSELLPHDVDDVGKARLRRVDVQEGKPRAPSDDVVRSDGVLLVERVADLGLDVRVPRLSSGREGRTWEYTTTATNIEL